MALPSPLRFLLLFILTTTTLATSILTLTIPPSNPLPNPNSLPAGTHATLTSLPSSSFTQGTSGQHKSKAPLTRSGTFTFHALPQASSPTSYLLDIRSAEYIFAPYRVDISADGTVLGIWETFRGNPWDNRGAEKFLADVSAPDSGRDVTVEAKVLARRGFYEERSTCTFFFFLTSPIFVTSEESSMANGETRLIGCSLPLGSFQEPYDFARVGRFRVYFWNAQVDGE